MFELSEQNAVEYLRQAGRVSDGEILVKSLSGGVANTVLQVFDTSTVACLVLKQPLPRFKTAADWQVDIARVEVERDCAQLLETLLPAGSVPRVLWFDAPNNILALSCAPADAVLWKKDLLAGHVSMDAATHAGMLLAIMHSSTANDAAIEKRYGDPAFFTQQRIDPYLHTAAEQNPDLRLRLDAIAAKLLAAKHCLIHGDFSPKNIFLVPHPADLLGSLSSGPKSPEPFQLSHLLLLDFEVAFYGHPAFDVATLINHFLLKGFHRGKSWRPFMLLADNFWQTYKATVDPALAREASSFGGHVLGALLLARVDGKSPVEYLVGNDTAQNQVRRAAHAILSEKQLPLDGALTRAASFLENPA
jgi:5-methylthioribose kinase